MMGICDVVVYLATLDAPVTRTTRLTAVFTSPARTTVTVSSHVITPGRILTQTPVDHTHRQIDTPHHHLECFLRDTYWRHKGTISYTWTRMDKLRWKWRTYKWRTV